jgi:hypothetical protein
MLTRNFAKAYGGSMTREDLEKQGAEIQTQLNALGIDLISKNQLGIKLLTQQELVAMRIEDGDYENEILEAVRMVEENDLTGGV